MAKDENGSGVNNFEQEPIEIFTKAESDVEVCLIKRSLQPLNMDYANPMHWAVVSQLLSRIAFYKTGGEMQSGVLEVSLRGLSEDSLAKYSMYERELAAKDRAMDGLHLMYEAREGEIKDLSESVEELTEQLQKCEEALVKSNDHIVNLETEVNRLQKKALWNERSCKRAESKLTLFRGAFEALADIQRAWASAPNKSKKTKYMQAIGMILTGILSKPTKNRGKE